MKFVYDPSGVGKRSGARAAVDVPRSPGCEAKVREYFEVAAHLTPGVDAATSFSGSECSAYEPAEHVASIAKAAGAQVASAMSTAPEAALKLREVGEY